MSSVVQGIASACGLYRLFPLSFVLAPFLWVIWVLRQPHKRFPENRQVS
jgi:hypothetical protein